MPEIDFNNPLFLTYDKNKMEDRRLGVTDRPDALRFASLKKTLWLQIALRGENGFSLPNGDDEITLSNAPQRVRLRQGSGRVSPENEEDGDEEPQTRIIMASYDGKTVRVETAPDAEADEPFSA